MIEIVNGGSDERRCCVRVLYVLGNIFRISKSRKIIVNSLFFNRKVERKFAAIKKKTRTKSMKLLEERRLRVLHCDKDLCLDSWPR